MFAHGEHELRKSGNKAADYVVRYLYLAAIPVNLLFGWLLRMVSIL